jgi:ABC-2 type transport system permease protein
MTLALVPRLVVELLVVSFALTAFGVAVASRIRSIQAFMAIMQLVLLPMFFASGALYPLRGLPGWLSVATRFDPLTYAVTALRHAVLVAAGAGASATPVTWGPFAVPPWLDLAVVFGGSLLALASAVPRFSRADV